MTQDQSGRGPSSGSIDPGVARRVEGLVDDAVSLAAKGGYGDAAARVQEALSLDPDNPEAKDLLDSYRRLAADDEERRRRRRSIAAAAAAIEEMIEAERIEEAVTAVEALALQYGREAPVEDLRLRIAQARSDGPELDELDAAIDAIRRPTARVATASQPDPSLDAAGTLAAEIETHLRLGRVEEAGRGLVRLESMPGAEDRIPKLRARIEEASHLAADHRREEEILIATAAIEDRIRRGSIDDAAERLAALAARHGSNAPVDELGARLEEARERAASIGRASPAAPGVAAPAAGVDGGARLTAELLDAERGRAGAEVTAEIDDAPAAGGQARWLGVAAAILVIVGGVGWWTFQRAGAPTTSRRAGEPAVLGTLAEAADASMHDQAAAGESDQPDAPVEGEAVGGGSIAAGAAPAERSPETSAPAADLAAPAPAAAAADSAAPEAGTASSEPPAPETAEEIADGATASAEDLAVPVPPPADAVASTAPADASESPEPLSESVASVEEPVLESGTELPGEALPADPAPSSQLAGAPPLPDRATPAETTAASPSGPAEVEAGAAQSRSQPEERDAAAPAVAGTDSATPAPARPEPAGSSLLGCGDPGVVCVRPVSVPQPVYPPAARQRRLSGTVVVNALVDETGKVVETRVESGSLRLFDNAAVAAASRAVFQPATRAGVPGRSWARLSFQFAP
ncbi:MAG TPA: TonB family protein [Thermoanaerobaculia bacterium]|nr:TonB family protein [Thermoanaerobaculia bacterium]